VVQVGTAVQVAARPLVLEEVPRWEQVAVLPQVEQAELGEQEVRPEWIRNWSCRVVLVRIAVRLGLRVIANFWKYAVSIRPMAVSARVVLGVEISTLRVVRIRIVTFCFSVMRGDAPISAIWELLNAARLKTA
jgi:hypothetical protein